MNKPTTPFTSVREHISQLLVDCLGDDGLAAKDGLSIQPRQLDYAQRWAETLGRAAQGVGCIDQKPHLLMLGADLGIGKSIAYSVPLLALACTRQRVAIATYSHLQQRQLIGTAESPGDLMRVAGWMAELGHGNLKIVRRCDAKGFISCRAIEELLCGYKNDKDRRITAEEIKDLELLLDFAIESQQGKNNGLIEDAIEQFGGQLPVGVASSDVCLTSLSPQEDREAFEVHLAAAEDADVVLLTHHHLAACAMYRKGKLSDRGFAAIVVDDADRMSTGAEKAFQFSLSLHRVESLLQRVRGPVGREAVSLAVDLSKAISAVQYGKKGRAMALSVATQRDQTNVEVRLNLLNEAVRAIGILEGVNPKLKSELEEIEIFMSCVLSSKVDRKRAAIPPLKVQA